MSYNYDFAIAGLVILCFIIYHFNRFKHLDNVHTNIFKFLLTISVFDVILDIISSMIMELGDSSFVNLNTFFVTIFYILQVLFPFTFLCYIQTLKSSNNKNLVNIIKRWVFLPIIMIILIFINTGKGFLFYFDINGNYIRGEWYLLMYFFTLQLVIITIFDTIINFKEFGWKKFANIYEYLLLATICVVLQAVYNNILMTSFGVGMGMFILYMTISNPNENLDSLTSAFNNSYFIDWVNELFINSFEFHVIAVEICNLRKINQVFGNNIGNSFLVAFSQKLHNLTNEKGYLFRTNGKRFIIVTKSLASYEQLKNDIYHFAKEGMEINGQSFKTKIVVCGIFFANELSNVDNLVAYTDYLVSLADNDDDTILIQKDEKTMHGLMINRKIETYLKSAIENNKVEVYYQPVYSLKEHKYVSLESLSRLYHPSLGNIPCDVFIDMAEKNGMILDLGVAQLHNICRFVKENSDILSMVDNIKINFSPLQLMKLDYCQKMIQIIKSYDLPCSFFQIEITETVATEYNASLHQVIKEFNNANIKICLDDFGSGYANFNTVLKVPFSTIKLDRSLLFDICDDPKVASFYRNISNSLIDMGYKVVAEGVETKVELDLLRRWGIDYIQGYYFSKPVSSKEIMNILKK
ncbi:MAG: GGDEF domain-containing phosphodiesterase [Firmicutes bacterium]|nr:GGDEF domain-containing phosphodiesterase [Bacillota bacterium]